MSVADVLLGVHIVAGAAAIALGPLALVWRRSKLPVGYQVAVAVLTGSALGLIALAPARIWWLLPFAVGTEAAVIGGWWIGRRQQVTRTPAQVRLMAGSYVSLMTALSVVSWGGLLAWVLPSAIGVVGVETAAARAGRAPRAA